MSGAIMILQVFLLSHILRLCVCVCVCVRVCAFKKTQSLVVFKSEIIFPNHLFTFTLQL